MQTKRQRPPVAVDDDFSPSPPPLKRARLARPPSSALPRLRWRAGPDLLSALSDELLIRVLSFLPLPHLLAVAPVSHRFYRLAADSQLWKALYYDRFVLPRAMRIPGFRTARGAGRMSGPGADGHKLHYSGRRQLWADGRRGGLVARGEAVGESGSGGSAVVMGRIREPDVPHESADWKKQYKLRHNWARGKCAVEELRLGEEAADAEEEGADGLRILVKVVEGFAITADKTSGLRAWDLKTRELVAHANLSYDDARDEEPASPSCLTLDDSNLDNFAISVAVGFVDGSFAVWRLDIRAGRLVRQYRHQKSINGELIGMALSYPYLLTATESVLVSLYTFDIPSQKEGDNELVGQDDAKSKEDVDSSKPDRRDGGSGRDQSGRKDEGTGMFPAPYLLTSLRSHTSRPPLALSIRKTATAAIASIAYTFSTRRGWSIGLQDLHIRPSSAGPRSAPEIATTRLAYTEPTDTGISLARHPPSYLSSPPTTPPRRPGHSSPASSPSLPPTVSSSPSSPLTRPPLSTPPTAAVTTPAITTTTSPAEPGPTTLSYTHPYLLAALPDNTLVLHLCTSTASSLDVSPGIRLWGHTSGISDAEITARGKAVSVSSRGDEMRVWELEGRGAGPGGRRSVEVRPGLRSPSLSLTPPDGKDPVGLAHGAEMAYGWDERRNWVGFDDEMVIVLRERNGGRESLMVYDFT